MYIKSYTNKKLIIKKQQKKQKKQLENKLFYRQKKNLNNNNRFSFCFLNFGFILKKYKFFLSKLSYKIVNKHLIKIFICFLNIIFS